MAEILFGLPQFPKRIMRRCKGENWQFFVVFVAGKPKDFTPG